ncbi:type II toxin-antitoxin system VapC family toxin [Stutzerimonas nitrititolerans]|uniref:type II toxin-antitoxin system VapC family toxin n=1 Tax=Stutzerimonas nitrititolerans TaxID=2482751 RepID=UPI0028ADE60F|nr:PIN domain-containing protein [Stutzerimonas nitrititolerans]
MAGKHVVYRDTSAFLALIIGEDNHGQGVLDALNSQAGAFDRGDIVLAMSTVGITEVLSFPLSDEAKTLFEGMIRRSNFQVISLSENLARRAALLRRHCYQTGKASDQENYKLSPPDAIHIASAMAIKADLLVTLDSRNKPKTKEMAMTQVTSFYPIADFASIPVQRPGPGMLGTSMF